MVFTDRVNPVEKVRAFSKSVPAIAAITAPPVVVFKREPEAIDEIASEVEVALVVVEFRAVKFWRVEDELARML